MEVTKLLILQFLAHILADFVFQSNKWAKQKNKKGFKSKYLYWHLLLVFAFSYALSFDAWFGLASLAITFLHFLTDGFKPKIANIKIGGGRPFKKSIFFIDQVMHIITLVAITLIYKHLTTGYLTDDNFAMLNVNQIAVITAYLLIFKPANIIIHEVLRMYDISFTGNKKSNEIPNAGKLIGILERILVLTLVIMAEYPAIGFLIAAKTILRYKDDTAKTEYVLVGTMLSFAVAIIIGISLKLI